jgi:hypothetical protein
VKINQNTTAEGEAGAAAPITLVYFVKHDLADMVRVADALRAAGVLVLPAVANTYMADAEAWKSPSDTVAITIKGYGDRPFTIDMPDQFESLDEYIAELLAVVQRAGRPVPPKVRVLYSVGGFSDTFVAEKMRLYGLEVATFKHDMPDPEVTVTYRDDRVLVRIGDAEHSHRTPGYFRSESAYARSLADLIHGAVQR